MKDNILQYLDSLGLDGLLDILLESYIREHEGRNFKYQNEIINSEDIKNYILENFDTPETNQKDVLLLRDFEFCPKCNYALNEMIDNSCPNCGIRVINSKNNI